MPYTEEQLHDMMNIEGPPTIRQLALQNLQHQEKDAAAAPAAVPATMLGQESDEESEGEEFLEDDQAPPASPRKEAVALHGGTSVVAHSTPPPVPWFPIFLSVVGVVCIAVILGRVGK